MLLRVPFISRSPARWLALALLLTWSGTVSAQQWPKEGTDELNQQGRKYKELIGKLRRGEAQPAENAEAVDVAAKLATYPFTWLRNQTEPGLIERMQTELDKDLLEAEKHKATSQAFLQAFAKQVAIHGGEVLQDGLVKPIGRLNVARALARVARTTGQEELADPLTDAITNPSSNDGVRYWAMRGLGELFAAIARRTPPAPMSAAREQKAVQALADFVSRKVTFAPDAPHEEIEGYRLLRREGVKALAQTRTPALADGKTRPALVLLKVMGRDESIRPEPRTDERVEAAIGLARMRPDQAKGYLPDYAGYQIGLFLSGDFAEVYSVRRANEVERQRPWKIYAARQWEALQGMKATTKDAYVGRMVDLAARFLAEMEAGTGKDADPRPLSDWLATNQPASKTLFKDVPDSVVKPADKEPAATEKATEEKDVEAKDTPPKKDAKDTKDKKKDGKDK
jgi:hypothetical protein